MKNYNKTLFLLMLCWYLKPLASDFEIETKFIPATTYSIKNGLPSNNIQDIIEDEDGFIWLATQKGLSRYDSNEFKNYSKDKSDPYSLPNILVEELLFMSNGKIWMSINEVGITIFDQFSQQFSSIKNNTTELFNMPNTNLFGMAKDKNGNAWFSIYGEGIYQWNIRQNKFIKHLQTNKEAWLNSKQTFEILIDQKNRLWVCTIDSLVYMYDIETGNSKEYNFSNNINDPLSNPIYGFAESKNGEIYAGGYSGVYKFDEVLSEFVSIIKEHELTEIYDGKHTSVRRLMIDSSENLWIGTTRSLLQYSNSKIKKVALFENGKEIQSDEAINAMIEGYEGNIWIGTEGNGLLKLAPDWNRYNIYFSKNKEPIDLRRAYQFKDTIWIAHPSSKMDSLRLDNNNLKQTGSLQPQLGSGNIRIDRIHQEEPSHLWVSSIQGVHKVNVVTGESLAVVNIDNEPLGSVRHLYKINQRFYFHLFSEEKMAYFNEDKMRAYVIDNPKEHQLIGNLVHHLEMGLNDELWLATNYGIESLNLKTHEFTTIFENDEKLGVTHFFIDGNDVWYISDGALHLATWSQGKLLPQEDKYIDILPLIKFFKIKRLKDNMMLVASEDNGLIELNIKSLAHKVYTVENGLPSDVVINVLFPDNVPMIFTEAGVATYNLDFQEPSPSKPKLVIDEVKHGDKKIPLISNNKLQLKYNYGSINFDVALLSYTNSSSIEYQYKLSGTDNQWLDTGNDDSYTFLNLDSGNYSFQVRGRSNYGVWSAPVDFTFSVEPAPWKSFWAYLIYTISAIILLLWLYYLYRRKIIYEHEIIKQQAQKQIADQASKAKSDFLARVSHEVRTPLNGVLGMGELMLDTKMDEEQQIYAETIIASGQHLLEIINDILDLSKIEAGKLELEQQEFDLLALMDELVVSFTSQTRQSGLVFTCIFDPELNRYRIGDIIRLKQILFNLLSNAFKFTKAGRITLKISTTKDEDIIDFQVVDTGIGLDANSADELFKPFVQADPTVTRKYGGTGLGLAIVKQLVEKMKGFIEVKSELGQGSQFHFQIELKINDQIPAPDLSLSPEPIALMIENPELKQSLSNYLNLLNQDFAVSISNQSHIVLTDQPKFASHSKDTFFINTQIYNPKTNYKQLNLPITFKALKELCQGEVPEELVVSEIQNNYLAVQKILYVEDNVINQQVGIEMIEKMGHVIDAVDNADEALTMLRRNVYNLLLVDYHLPLVNGLSLIQNWDNKRNIPILVVTADLTDEVYQNCRKLNVKQIVSKPFSQNQLCQAIESAFEG